MKAINKALFIGATALTLTATAASAAVVCNDDGDCWHVSTEGRHYVVVALADHYAVGPLPLEG